LKTSDAGALWRDAARGSHDALAVAGDVAATRGQRIEELLTGDVAWWAGDGGGYGYGDGGGDGDGGGGDGDGDGYGDGGGDGDGCGGYGGGGYGGGLSALVEPRDEEQAASDREDRRREKKKGTRRAHR
jgi:hypothetical protein